jgi:ribosomal protein S18 acetylase RimI-like enzyme
VDARLTGSPPESMQISVDKVSEVTPDLVAAFARLVPQLSPSAAPLDADALCEIATDRGTSLLVARDPMGEILGTLTLLCFRIPSGRRGRIESLVVDRDARGRGIGRLLCEAALIEARRRGVDAVDLTSSPEREAANALYQRMGFRLRATNTYRFMLARAVSETSIQ